MKEKLIISNYEAKLWPAKQALTWPEDFERVSL